MSPKKESVKRKTSLSVDATAKSASKRIKSVVPCNKDKDDEVFISEHDRNRIHTFIYQKIDKGMRAHDILKLFEEELDLRHVDNKDVELLIEQNKDDIHNQKFELEHLAIRLYIQTKKAETVFSMLDQNGKGVVIVEDLQHVANDIFGLDDKVSDEDLDEMIQLFDQSNDGILTIDDVVRIARTINLS